MSNSADKITTHSSALEYPWQEKTWSQFTKARSQDQLPHAILLSGEDGIAKLALAKRMAKSLLCMKTTASSLDACNECQSCKTYASGANPDFTSITLLEDKQQIGVDQIRSLAEFLNFSRSFNTHRVVIINPVERMNLNAANSLLKSLEEPSAHTIMILVTAKMSQLLPTIKSRCQLFNVSTPTKVQTINWLKNQQRDNSSDNINPEILVEIAGTKPLNAIKINREDVEHREQFIQDLAAVIQHRMTITEVAKKWEKHDVEILLDWQIIHLQNIIKSPYSGSDISLENKNEKYSLTLNLSDEEHWLLYQNLIKQKQYIHTSVNPLMFLENMLMLWTKTI